MKATLISTQERPSKHGGKFYYAFFKGEDGESYRSCLYPNCGNFVRWKGLIGKKNIVLEGLALKGKIVDADSFPKVVCEAHPDDTEVEAAVRANNLAQETLINLAAV